MLQQALTFRYIFTSHRSNGILILCCRNFTSTELLSIFSSPIHSTVKSASRSTLTLNTLYSKCNPSYFLHAFNSLAHGSSDRQPYKREAASILSSRKLLGIQKALETQGIWSKDVMFSFRNWLLTEESTVDPDETRKRWCRMRKKWSRYQDKDRFRSLFISELKSQRDIFT